jgi:hypothetical protein
MPKPILSPDFKRSGRRNAASIPDKTIHMSGFTKIVIAAALVVLGMLTVVGGVMRSSPSGAEPSGAHHTLAAD